VTDIIKANHRLSERGDDAVSRVHRLRGPEVEHARRAIEVVLARPIELLEQVLHPKRLTGMNAIPVRRGEGDPVRVGIDVCGADGLVGPVPLPVPEEPHVLGAGPAQQAIVVEREYGKP
jgi:hypothetical protein